MERIKVNQIVIDKKLEEIKRKILNEIYSDLDFVRDVITKHGFSEEIVDSYANQFLTVKREYGHCKDCKGLNHCKNENNGMTLALILDGKYIEKSYQPCRFWLNHLNRRKNIVIKHFSDEFDNLSVDMLQDYGDEHRLKLIGQLKKVCNGERDKWLFICGEPQSDKTTFAISLLNTLVAQNKEKVAFIDMPSLLRELSKNVFDDKESFNRLFENLKNVDTLVLDDFSSGYMNNVIRESFILPLINARFRDNKFTVFTSRMSIKDSCALIIPKESNREVNPQFVLFYDVIRTKSIRFIVHHLIL